MSTDDAISPTDRRLLEALGRLARQVDPAPAYVLEAGRAAFGMRRLDDELAELAELAELMSDSRQQSAGVRGAASDSRLLTFEAGGLGVDLQVSPSGGRLLLLGQVVGGPTDGGGVGLETAGGGAVALETAGGEVGRAELDDLGGFRIEGVTPGRVRLRLTRPGAPAVVTTWVTL